MGHPASTVNVDPPPDFVPPSPCLEVFPLGRNPVSGRDMGKPFASGFTSVRFRELILGKHLSNVTTQEKSFDREKCLNLAFDEVYHKICKFHHWEKIL